MVRGHPAEGSGASGLISLWRGRPAERPRALSRPFGRPEHHVRAQHRDAIRAQPAQQLPAKPILLVRAQSIDRAPVTGPEHDVPEPVRLTKVVPAGDCLGGGARYAGPREQLNEGPGGGDFIPRVERLDRAGSTSRTQSQKWVLAGSNRRGPQVVMARTPPGLTSRHMPAVKAAMSGAKNTPNTHTTASKPPSGSPALVASPRRNSTFASPSLAALARASSSMGSARSTPITRPPGPTARAEGIADAPAPQHRSSTASPAASGSRATVAAP